MVDGTDRARWRGTTAGGECHRSSGGGTGQLDGAGDRRSDDRQPRGWPAGWPRHAVAKTAVEMTSLRKPQPGSHRDLEISQRTRDSHIPTADHVVDASRRKKRRAKTEIGSQSVTHLSGLFCYRCFRLRKWRAGGCCPRASCGRSVLNSRRIRSNRACWCRGVVAGGVVVSSCKVR
jgi:hypothetical protein